MNQSRFSRMLDLIIKYQLMVNKAYRKGNDDLCAAYALKCAQLKTSFRFEFDPDEKLEEF